MKKIMIIDDEKDFCMFLKANLELTGDYEVVAFLTAADCLANIKMVQPDLIVLDVVLGDRDGLDVLRDIKKNPETAVIPVVMLTAMGDRFAQCKALDAADYVVKPVSRMVLMETFKKVLDHSSPRSNRT